MNHYNLPTRDHDLPLSEGKQVASYAVVCERVIGTMRRVVTAIHEATIVRFVNWYCEGRVWKDDEENATYADAMHDPGVEEFVEEAIAGEGVAHLCSAMNPGISKFFAQCARNELHIGKLTIANEMVVKDYLYRKMKIHGMRETHITKCLPRALKLAFMKSEHEIIADREVATVSACADRRRGDTRWYSRGRPWIGNWLGSKEYMPVARPE